MDLCAITYGPWELEYVPKGGHWMKLSDYIALFLREQNIRHAFVVTGGAAAHLIDSVDREPGIDYVCTQHEQASAMAADAYARTTGNLGVAIATSGPGATNMITGCCCSYYDSVPVIYITGQVATFRLKRDSGVRQLGFQETDVVDMFRPITKYAILLEDPFKIRYILEKAVYMAKSGRPGPVLVDVPDNLQRVDINPNTLEKYVPEVLQGSAVQFTEKIEDCFNLFRGAKRPVMILGWGIRLSGAEAEVRNLVELLGFPVLLTWGVLDLIPFEHRLVIGSFGLHGTRYGNFAVQNADLVVAIGTRLDTHVTGTPVSGFAREAKKIMVDIDECELNKFSKHDMKIDVAIAADVKQFADVLNRGLMNYEPTNISNWLAKINTWKEQFPICPDSYHQEEKINPYVFVKTLSKETQKGDVLFVDTGCSVAWVAQAFEFKEDQRLFSAFNNTPMGYALPASIGACFALNRKRIICISGDGGLQMNLQELATVVRHNLPVKIFLINNHGYSMIQQTQEQWLDSRYAGSTVEGGLAFPDFVLLAKTYGFKTVTITKNLGHADKIREVLEGNGPVFCNIEVDPGHRVIPQVVFGRPIEDSGPLLPRDVFLNQMIVQPADASLE